MEEIRGFTWCLKTKCSNGVTSVNNLSYFEQIFVHIRKQNTHFVFQLLVINNKKWRTFVNSKTTTNSLLSPDVCKLSAAMSHIHWAKLLIAVKNETNGTTEKILDWRRGDWPFHHALSESGLLLIREEAKQRSRFFRFLGQRACSTVCISSLHSE